MSETIETVKSDKIHLGPGIYPNIPMADYFKIDAISSHTLQWMDVSPKHFKAALDGRLKREDTAAFSFGRAFHARLLEPATFKDRYAIRLQCQAKLKSGDRKGEACGLSSSFRMPDGSWACTKHADGMGERVEDSVTPDELDRIECCCEAVRDTDAVKLLRRKGQCEVVLVSEYKGLLVKGRLDKLILEPSIILDAKKVAAPTTPSQARITDGRFADSIPSYGYGVQTGIYRWLVQDQCKVSPEFWWLVVEDDEPMDVAVYKPCKATRAACQNLALGLLDRVVECTATNSWPGVGNDVVEISAPSWFLKRYGQE